MTWAGGGYRERVRQHRLNRVICLQSSGEGLHLGLNRTVPSLHNAGSTSCGVSDVSVLHSERKEASMSTECSRTGLD